MQLSTNTYQPKRSSYNVSVPVFEGPLDLLLFLIEKEELDITVLSLAQVTEQYLAHIKNLTDKDPESISGFLVVAAKLIQIKSNVLLPRKATIDPTEEDDGESLARQLIEYRKYKQIARLLDERMQQNYRSYIRVSTPLKVEGKLDLGGQDVFWLQKTMQDILFGHIKEPLAQVVATPKVTIREKITDIVTSIKRNGAASFYTVLGQAKGQAYSRLHAVVAFLAMLELIKRRRIVAQQDTIFSDIHMEPAEAWSDQIEVMELEFGE